MNVCKSIILKQMGVKKCFIKNIFFLIFVKPLLTGRVNAYRCQICVNLHKSINT